MPRLRHTVLAAVVIALLAPVVAAQDRGKPRDPGKKIYCWNEGGRKVCGDALPASAADSARTEISSRSGMATGKVDRALTGDERAAAAIAAESARLQAEAEAAVKRRDLAMVESYAAESDLRRAYGERIALLDATLKADALGTDNLRQSLLNLLRQAGDLEVEDKPVPKRLADTIRTQHDQLLQLQAMRVVHAAERQALDAELQDAVNRYRSLKGLAPASAPSPSPAAAPTAPAPAPPAGG